MKKPDIMALCVTEDTSVRDTIKTIDRSGRISMALLVDAGGRLVSTITDGDIRRGIMAGFGLDAPLRDILPIKAGLPNPNPVTAPEGIEPAAQLKIMKERAVRQLPLLDKEGTVSDIVLLADLLPQKLQEMRAVIMAGGYGTRLKPLTDEVPKPMLPVGGRPLMERTVEQLRDAGIRQIVVTTHYLSEKIMEHFGDGREFDVTLNYVREDSPLGTGGALALVPTPRSRSW